MASPRRGPPESEDEVHDLDTPAAAFYERAPGTGHGETPLPLPSSRTVRRRWDTSALQRTPGWRCLDCPTVVRGAEGALREAAWAIHRDLNPTHHREVLS